MRICIMSECICMPAGNKYHREEIHEDRECQGLGGERVASVFLCGVVKEVSPEEIRD